MRCKKNFVLIDMRFSICKTLRISELAYRQSHIKKAISWEKRSFLPLIADWLLILIIEAWIDMRFQIYDMRSLICKTL